MPGMTPLRPDDVHSARAWAAFVAADAATAAPPSLDARVLLAAQAALRQKQRADVEQTRRRWCAGLSALAASLLAAAAWSLAPPSAAVPSGAPPAAPAAVAAASRSVSVPYPDERARPDEPAGRPVPMTNIEAGRVLASPPQRLLASRPLFDPADGRRPVSTPGRPRARAFGAPVVEPVAAARRPAASVLRAATAPATDAQPLAAAPAAVAGPAPEAWSSRGTRPIFDPDSAEFAPAEPTFRLERVMPAPVRRGDPPAPPD